MKKIIKQLLPILLILSMLAGCGSPQNEAAIPDSGEPPCMLRFAGMDDYFSFAASARLPDAEFAKYVQNDPNYSSNGINSKEDVLRLVEAVESAPFPVINEKVETSLIIYLESNWLDVVCFTPGSEEYFCRFMINMTAGSGNQTLRATKKNNSNLTKIAAEDSMTELYGDNAESMDKTYYVASVDGKAVRIWVNDGATSQTDKLLPGLQFVSIKDLE